MYTVLKTVLAAICTTFSKIISTNGAGGIPLVSTGSKWSEFRILRSQLRNESRKLIGLSTILVSFSSLKINAVTLASTSKGR